MTRTSNAWDSPAEVFASLEQLAASAHRALAGLEPSVTSMAMARGFGASIELHLMGLRELLDQRTEQGRRR